MVGGLVGYQAGRYVGEQATNYFGLEGNTAELTSSFLEVAGALGLAFTAKDLGHQNPQKSVMLLGRRIAGVGAFASIGMVLNEIYQLRESLEQAMAHQNTNADPSVPSTNMITDASYTGSDKIVSFPTQEWPTHVAPQAIVETPRSPVFLSQDSPISPVLPIADTPRQPIDKGIPDINDDGVLFDRDVHGNQPVDSHGNHVDRDGWGNRPSDIWGRNAGTDPYGNSYQVENGDFSQEDGSTMDSNFEPLDSGVS